MEDLRTFERFMAAAAELQGKDDPADHSKTTDHPLLDDKQRKKMLREHGPGVLNADTQKRIHSVVFHPNVKTLDEAKARHQMLIDAMDDGRS